MGPRSPDSPVLGDPPVQEMKAGEERSGDGASACENSSSVATPSSVHLTGSVLTRDLSDLSGSYMNGSPLPPNGRGSVPRNIFGSPRDSPLTIRQPWRQAFSLSSPAPDIDGPMMPLLSTHAGTDDFIMIEQNGGVEVMPPEPVQTPEKMPLDLFETAAEMTSHERFPIIIVLMNPCYKTYELMQLWLDGRTDTVRQVLQTLRQALPSTWSQDYDGLAQFRRNRLSQLINCLRIQQFEVVPCEIWVAKPWALSAEKTAAYAENLLDHMRRVGVVSSTACDSPRRGGGDEPQAGECVMTLSPDARSRIHAPDGIMTHHHAIQYLSFRPPFEKPFDKPPVFPKFTETAGVNRSAACISSTNDLLARAASPAMSDDVLDVSTSSYPEINIESGDLQSRVLSPLSSRVVSPDSLDDDRSKASSLHFSTDSSTEESQVWDDGTVKMTANLGDRRFSLQNIASQYELSFKRRKGPSGSNRGKSLRCFRTFFSGLVGGKNRNDEAVGNRRKSEECTVNMSFGHDDNSLGRHILKLHEVDSEEELSMADMPLLHSSRDKITFEKDFLDDEYAT